MRETGNADDVVESYHQYSTTEKKIKLVSTTAFCNSSFSSAIEN